jgi:hypothetical protein
MHEKDVGRLTAFDDGSHRAFLRIGPDHEVPQGLIAEVLGLAAGRGEYEEPLLRVVR